MTCNPKSYALVAGMLLPAPDDALSWHQKPSRLARDVSAFACVRWTGVWPGIEVVARLDPSLTGDGTFV